MEMEDSQKDIQDFVAEGIEKNQTPEEEFPARNSWRWRTLRKTISATFSFKRQTRNGTYIPVSTIESSYVHTREVSKQESEHESEEDWLKVPPLERPSRYELSQGRRGKVYVFNHKVFKKLDERLGAEKDEENLNNAMLMLGFRKEDIIVFSDFTKSEVKTKLKEISKEDHKESDCLLIFVLSHGSKGGHISAKDKFYKSKALWKNFYPKYCTGLIGKPKIFFIIACQGDKKDNGIQLNVKNWKRQAESDNAPVDSSEVIIPVEADFLTVHSSAPGYKSYRSRFTGTWYVQALYEEVKQVNLKSMHLLDILTNVSGRVAFNFSTEEGGLQKQCPLISSTLTRLFYLTEEETQ